MVLPNGVRIVYERMPGVRTVALGIWVESGSRHEPEGLGGISHFIEHMVFKGTERRSARDIAEEMDAIGGQMNAYTAAECTCFYARVLDVHGLDALDVLCDMFFHAGFDERDVALERGVVFEEIGMYEDSPEDLVVDRLSEAVFRDTALGRPILGTKAALRRMDGRVLRRYRESHYTSKGVVVSVCGNVSDALLCEIRDTFARMPEREKPGTEVGRYHRCITLRNKAIEQNHICLGYPAPGCAGKDRYAVRLLNAVLGGGMSSRLFQRVREEAGLCYSVSSFVNAYQDVGLFQVYAALGRENERAALRMILEEIERLRSEPVDARELMRAKEQFKAGLLMGLESTSARMNSLAQGVLRFGRIVAPEELIEGVEAVSARDILDVARRMLDPGEASFSGVGAMRDARAYRGFLDGFVK